MMLPNVWNDQEADTKNRLLRSVAGSGVEQITELQTKWDKLELLIESHELMIKEQVPILAELLDYLVCCCSRKTFWFDCFSLKKLSNGMKN